MTNDEINRIVDAFLNHKEIEDFSVVVPYDKLIEKNCSLSAGQYFDVKIDYVDITAEEFQKRMSEYQNTLSELFRKGKELEDDIMKQMGRIEYEN